MIITFLRKHEFLINDSFIDVLQNVSLMKRVVTNESKTGDDMLCLNSREASGKRNYYDKLTSVAVILNFSCMIWMCITPIMLERSFAYLAFFANLIGTHFLLDLSWKVFNQF